MPPTIRAVGLFIPPSFSGVVAVFVVVVVDEFALWSCAETDDMPTMNVKAIAAIRYFIFFILLYFGEIRAMFIPRHDGVIIA
jgi:hypothetical protein